MMISAILGLFGFVAGMSATVYCFGTLAMDAAHFLSASNPLPQVPATPRKLPPRQLTFVEPHPSARCPVCRTGIQGQVRMCPDCRVLSHEDCWTFQGGCGIFGCGERGLAER